MRVYGSAVDPVGPVSWEHLPASIGVFQAIMGGMQLYYPVIYRFMTTSSRDPKGISQVTQSIARGVGLGILVASSIGFLGYTLYGKQSQPSFVQNIGREPDLKIIPGLGFLIIACSTLFAVSVATSFPMTARPLVDGT